MKRKSTARPWRGQQPAPLPARPTPGPLWHHGQSALEALVVLAALAALAAALAPAAAGVAGELSNAKASLQARAVADELADAANRAAALGYGNAVVRALRTTRATRVHYDAETRELVVKQAGVERRARVTVAVDVRLRSVDGRVDARAAYANGRVRIERADANGS